MAAPIPDAMLATPAPPPLPSLVNARRLRTQRLGRGLRLWVPAGVLILLLAICFLLPLVVTLPSSTNGDIIVNNEPPFSPGHWLGTNVQGVDIFSQLVYGGQVAFEIGVAVTLIGFAIGGTLGVVAGYFGGWVDAVHLAGARHPDRVPRPGARAGHRRGARAERVPRDLGAVGVRHPGDRADHARRHADDARAAVHDRRAAVQAPAPGGSSPATSCRTSCPSS